MRKEKTNPVGPRKLDLNRETLHQLEQTSLETIAGGRLCLSVRDSCYDPT